jgi:REP element-mobilizing transposase RayT
MLYHIMARGNDKGCIFEDDDDHRRFLELLARDATRFQMTCLAYCLQWNHYHLLIVPGQFPVSRMLQQLNSTYCQWFNWRHQRVGHVLQGRFKSRMVEGVPSWLVALRYVLLNPVAAQRVAHPADWPWSSYAATAGLAPVPEFLHAERVLALFDATDESRARELFQQFICGADPREPLPDGMVMSSRDLGELLTPLLQQHRQTREYVYAERFAVRPPLAAVLRDAATPEGIACAARRAFDDHAYTLQEIGAAVKRPPATVWTWIRRDRARLRLHPSPTLPPALF